MARLENRHFLQLAHLEKANIYQGCPWPGICLHSLCCRSNHKHGASPTYPPFCKGPQGRWHGDGGWAAGPACHLLATFTYRTPFPLDTQTAYRGPSCMSLEGLCSICSSVLCKKCLGLGVNGLLESLIALNHFRI